MQLQQRYDEEFPELQDVCGQLDGWVRNWNKKAELFQVPAIQKKMNQQQVDGWKKEVKATLRRIHEARKKAFSLLTFLKKNGKLLKETLMGAKQTDTSPILQVYNDLTAKQQAAQTVYDKFQETVPKVEQAGQAIQKFTPPRVRLIQNPPTQTSVDLSLQQEKVLEECEIVENKEAEDSDEDAVLVNDENSTEQVDLADWVEVEEDFEVENDLDD